MESLKKNKILLSLLGVTVLAVAAYYLFFSGGSSTAPGSGSVDTSLPAGGVGAQIVTMLNSINAASIDPTVFSSTAWTSLRDLSAPVPTNTPGRTDLFGALSGTSVFGIGTVSTTTLANVTGATQGSQ
jgi:hypothetical protein